MIRILVIEDEDDLRKALRIRFEREGFMIYSAEDAESGLELAGEVKPDLIVMDVLLPGEMDGFEATYRVKHDDILKGIPVVILTVRAAQEDKIHGLRNGADAYMTKPFDHEDLVITVKSLVGRTSDRILN